MSEYFAEIWPYILSGLVAIGSAFTSALIAFFNYRKAKNEYRTELIKKEETIINLENVIYQIEGAKKHEEDNA